MSKFLRPNKAQLIIIIILFIVISFFSIYGASPVGVPNVHFGEPHFRQRIDTNFILLIDIIILVIASILFILFSKHKDKKY